MFIVPTLAFHTNAEHDGDQLALRFPCAGVGREPIQARSPGTTGRCPVCRQWRKLDGVERPKPEKKPAAKPKRARPRIQPDHGSPSGYNRCRCTRCKAARSEYDRERWLRRKAAKAEPVVLPDRAELDRMAFDRKAAKAELERKKELRDAALKFVSQGSKG